MRPIGGAAGGSGSVGSVRAPPPQPRRASCFPWVLASRRPGRHADAGVDALAQCWPCLSSSSSSSRRIPIPIPIRARGSGCRWVGDCRRASDKIHRSQSGCCTRSNGAIRTVACAIGRMNGGEQRQASWMVVDGFDERGPCGPERRKRSRAERRTGAPRNDPFWACANEGGGCSVLQGPLLAQALCPPSTCLLLAAPRAALRAAICSTVVVDTWTIDPVCSPGFWLRLAAAAAAAAART
jgi:hypothetical protein